MKSFKKAVAAGVVLACVVLASSIVAAEGAGSTPSTSSGQASSPQVLGDWEFKTQIEARTQTATVTFNKNADGTYSGTWIGQRGGENALSDVTFEGGKVKFARTSNFGGQEQKTTYDGVVDGSKLTGKGKSNFGEFTFEGALQGQAKSGAEAICGEWQVSTTTPARTMVEKMTISKSADGKLAGKWAGERGESTISDVNFAAGKLTFTRTSKFGDREFSSKFAGTVEGDQIKGVFTSDRGETAITATRAGAEKKPEAAKKPDAEKKADSGASNIVGKWELSTDSPQGARTRVLTINKDMTGTYQMRDSDVPIKDLKVDGNKISFTVESTGGDRQFKMDFKGEIDGANMKGQFTSDRGPRDVTGKKVG